jgi:hypothetical protein
MGVLSEHAPCTLAARPLIPNSFFCLLNPTSLKRAMILIIPACSPAFSAFYHGRKHHFFVESAKISWDGLWKNKKPLGR